MRKAIKEIEFMLVLGAMILFVVFSVQGLRCLNGAEILNGEAENADCGCENRGSDGCAAVVVDPYEVCEHKQKVDVDAGDDRPRPEPEAGEEQGRPCNETCNAGKKHGANLVPVHDRFDEDSKGRHGGRDDGDGLIVNFNMCLLGCLMCLFTIVLPVSLKNIIP